MRRDPCVQMGHMPYTQLMGFLYPARSLSADLLETVLTTKSQGIWKAVRLRGVLAVCLASRSCVHRWV